MKSNDPVVVMGALATALVAEKELRELINFLDFLKENGGKDSRGIPGIKERLESSSPQKFHGYLTTSTKMRGAIEIRYNIISATVTLLHDANQEVILDEVLCFQVRDILNER